MRTGQQFLRQLYLPQQSNFVGQSKENRAKTTENLIEDDVSFQNHKNNQSDKNQDNYDEIRSIKTPSDVSVVSETESSLSIKEHEINDIPLESEKFAYEKKSWHRMERFKVIMRGQQFEPEWGKFFINIFFIILARCSLYYIINWSHLFIGVFMSLSHFY